MFGFSSVLSQEVLKFHLYSIIVGLTFTYGVAAHLLNVFEAMRKVVDQAFNFEFHKEVTDLPHVFEVMTEVKDLQNELKVKT